MREFKRAVLAWGLAGAVVCAGAWAAAGTGRGPVAAPPPGGAGDAGGAGVAEFESGLWIEGVAESGRRLVNLDAVVARLARGGAWSPTDGEALERAWKPDEQRVWRGFEVKAGGMGTPVGRGYAAVTVRAGQAGVVMLEARGHGMVYVNGEPRQGDPYGVGTVRLPMALRAEENLLLFASAGRGAMSARLTPPRSAVELHGADVTKPDVIRGESGPWLVGVPVINAGEASRRVEVRARVRARGGEAGGAPRAWGPSVGVWLAPLGVVKTVVSVEASAADAHGEGVPIEVAVFADGPAAESGAEANPIDRLETALRVRGADEQHTRTFVSAIDGSVQYYAVVPAAGAGGVGATGRPGMVLSLHGAGVEATGQAGSYAGKPGLVIVCPTNRRPFGFDWEDWGRLDAVEVMEDASRRYGVDPERVYLTGHSMGGHGTWSIGTLMPHAFAAVAPSAGWLSFESYGGAVRFPGASDATKGMGGLLRRAFAGSDTQARMANLRGRGVYVLHGDADDNVPVREARAARAILEKLQIALGHHEEPGAGHWWDNDPGPGAACLDWPAIFETFAQRPPLDASVGDEAELVLTEAGPVLMRERSPLAIDAQARRGERSRVRARVDRATGSVEVETENAARVVIGPRLVRETAVTRMRVDGGDVAIRGARPGTPIVLEWRDGAWGVASGIAAERAARSIAPGAGRLPGFKGALDGDFALVYGTAGTPEENAWTLAKARFDAEQWWYRGNGRAEVLSDREFLHRSHVRNAIVYGHRQCNEAWDALLGESGVVVERGRVTLEGRVFTGDDLHAFVVHPMAHAVIDSMGSKPLVGAVAATGRAGMVAAERYPVFSSGVGFPDVLVMRASAWSVGLPGVLAAGWWGDGGGAQGEMEWGEEGEGGEAGAGGG